MTEHEFRQLPQSVRSSTPLDELERLIGEWCLTLDDMAERLTIEGWTYIGEALPRLAARDQRRD